MITITNIFEVVLFRVSAFRVRFFSNILCCNILCCKKNCTKNIFQLSVLTLCSALFMGCGDSSSEAPSPGRANLPSPDQAPPSIGNASVVFETSDITLYGKQTANVGESVGFAIIPQRPFAKVSWRQVSGPEVQILAEQSMTVGFDAPSPGEYEFMVDVSFVDGETESVMHQISVSPSQEQQVNVRLDHTVSELGKVSLHADVGSNAVSNITWTQISGPQIDELNTQNEFVFFDAPAVNGDAVIEIRANVSFNDGSRATDTAIVTVRDVDFDTEGLFYSNNFVITQDMHAYNPLSLFKPDLERCVYNNQIPATPNCTFAQLPLIGTSNNNPSIQDILDRTLVSHQWMGDNFKAYLENSAAGEDMLKLLRGVTAVVISYDVRPSFYWVATGAIYLDARNFWQSPEERDTLNDQADFRSDFGNVLNFSVFWRYTKNNEYYPANTYVKSARESRSFEDLEASISWLMYHELAHANDFFPSTTWQNVGNNTTPLAYFQNNSASSEELDRQYPLRSDELHALAQVSFSGETPTSQQVNYRGNDIEGFFTPDIASSYYSYFTTREDYATLVERFMMLYRLGAEADLAIIDDASGDDFIVTWGQRNRISELGLRDRTAFAVSRAYPELGSISNVAQLQAQLPSPLLMDTTKGWFENVDLSSGTDSVSANRKKVRHKYDVLLRSQLDQQRPHEGAPFVY